MEDHFLPPSNSLPSVLIQKRNSSFCGGWGGGALFCGKRNAFLMLWRWLQLRTRNLQSGKEKFWTFNSRVPLFTYLSLEKEKEKKRKHDWQTSADRNSWLREEEAWGAHLWNPLGCHRIRLEYSGHRELFCNRESLHRLQEEAEHLAFW